MPNVNRGPWRPCWRPQPRHRCFPKVGTPVRPPPGIHRAGPVVSTRLCHMYGNRRPCKRPGSKFAAQTACDLQSGRSQGLAYMFSKHKVLIHLIHWYSDRLLVALRDGVSFIRPSQSIAGHQPHASVRRASHRIVAGTMALVPCLHQQAWRCLQLHAEHNDGVKAQLNKSNNARVI